VNRPPYTLLLVFVLVLILTACSSGASDGGVGTPQTTDSAQDGTGGSSTSPQIVRGPALIPFSGQGVPGMLTVGILPPAWPAGLLSFPEEAALKWSVSASSGEEFWLCFDAQSTRRLTDFFRNELPANDFRIKTDGEDARDGRPIHRFVANSSIWEIVISIASSDPETDITFGGVACAFSVEMRATATA